MAVQQARWNARIGTPCEFVLLNSLSTREVGTFREGVDFLRIDPFAGGIDAQCEQLEVMLKKIQPNGTTPLTERLGEIHRRIQMQSDELVRAGQNVILIIATDGMPTSTHSGSSSPGDRTQFVAALRRITGDLPVHVVIRLTTDEDSIVDFYNKIDEELEISLEVLDD